ncbi:MAG: hypothetical protein DI607_04975 [Sphingomonas hengshuiensis]|nr:MAG: hypothetical protein DI607_04975 [Sphingomonas hengshuiensis]
MDMPPITLPPPIDGTPTLSPVRPPAGSPNDPANRSLSQAVEQAAAEPVPMKREVATLDFVNPEALIKRVKIAHPFRLDGQIVDCINLRRLNTEEVSQAVLASQLPDPFELYAQMAGLPAPVLRGLPDIDGLEVAEVASGFLPPLLRTAYGFA